MKTKCIKLLACPECKGNLKCKTFYKNKQEIIEGVLTCTICDKEYPIYNAIPRMLEKHLLEIPEAFAQKYNFKTLKSKISKKNILIKNSSEVFGDRWKVNQDFGFTNTNKNVKFVDHNSLYFEKTYQFAVEAFKRRSFLSSKELDQKLVLDAGAGIGRYSRIANEMGAEVFSLDISNSVDVIKEKLKNNKIHIVQGDLMKPPFKKETFDTVFCLQVIMHTPDPRESFRRLSDLVKKGGQISVNVYAKGNVLYEFNDWFLRSITTKLRKKEIWKFSNFIASIGKIIIKNKYLFAGVNAFCRIKPYNMDMFDWYAPKVASHHTDKEIKEWFKENKISFIKTDDPRVNPYSFHAKLYPKFTKNRKGQVNHFFYSLVPRWGISMSGIKN